jgi:hypothetical protein
VSPESAGLIVSLFIATAVATNALALAFFVSGLRAPAARRSQRAARCFMLGLLQGVVGAGCSIAGLGISFGGVAGADPSEKALLLSKGISTVQAIRPYAVPAALPPIVFAVVLFGGRGRSPPSPDAADAPQKGGSPNDQK